MSHQQVRKDLNIEQLSNEYRTWYERGTNEVRRTKITKCQAAHVRRMYGAIQKKNRICFKF